MIAGLFYTLAILALAFSRNVEAGGVVLAALGVVFAAIAIAKTPVHALPFGTRLGGFATGALALGALFFRLRNEVPPPALLTVLLLVPLLGALVVLFTPRQWVDGIRRTSLAFMLLELYLSSWLLEGDYSTASYQFREAAAWIPAFGIHYELGIDGISLWLVLLTTLLTPIALHVSWGSVSTKIKEYAFAFLLLEVGMVGAFVALDLFLFYVFWELMLVPMYLVIGVWGGKERIYAAVKFALYTLVGSLLMLVAVLYLVARYHELAVAANLPVEQQWSFSVERLTHVVLSFEEQCWLFAAFALAFAIKVPMFPLHTWLPDAHVQAPTGGSVILAAVLLKLGGYGFLRFAMPLFPYAAHWVGPTLAVFAVIGIIYGAVCAWVQRDVKKLVAYSSVSHLGFVMLGIFSMNAGGVAGAVLQMIAHGISTGALFILVGVVYDRRHSRDLADFGGLAKVMPWYAVIFVVVAMSSAGLPGTNGFVGEFLILSGTFVSTQLSVWEKVFALFAATGVILAAVYMLHAVLKMFWGPLDKKENQALADVNHRETLALLPLVAAVFWMGLFPDTMLESIRPSVDHLIATYDTRWHGDWRDDSPRLLPFAEGGEGGAPGDADSPGGGNPPGSGNSPGGGGSTQPGAAADARPVSGVAPAAGALLPGGGR